MDPSYNQPNFDIQKNNIINIAPPIIQELTDEFLLQEAHRVMQQVKNLQQAKETTD